MKQLTGDLIQMAQKGNFDVIIHGCNCFCSMDAGIARSIKDQFPEAYEADLRTGYGDRLKLGTFSTAHVGRLRVVNAYTQYHWRGQGRKVDYEAVRKVFKAIKKEFSGQRIGYPAIGAGLAGGDWKVLAQIIGEELEGEDHTYVVYKA